MVGFAAIYTAVKLKVLRKKAIYGHVKGQTNLLPNIRDIEVRATKASSWPYYHYNRSNEKDSVQTKLG